MTKRKMSQQWRPCEPLPLVELDELSNTSLIRYFSNTRKLAILYFRKKKRTLAPDIKNSWHRGRYIAHK